MNQIELKYFDIELVKERQSYITKQLVYSSLINMRIGHSSKVMNITVLRWTNPGVNLKRMHQVYNVVRT